jgi:hypothetical protein
MDDRARSAIVTGRARRRGHELTPDLYPDAEVRRAPQTVALTLPST